MSTPRERRSLMRFPMGASIARRLPRRKAGPSRDPLAAARAFRSYSSAMAQTGDQVLQGARALRDYAAQTLSTIVRIPSFSGKEEAVCRKIAALCAEAGFDEVRFDGLGSVIARVGKGPRKLAIDAHVDTVGVGDPSRWETDPFSGLVRDGLVLGRGTADQKGGAAAMIAAGTHAERPALRRPLQRVFHIHGSRRRL